jgi:hypothetical protein
MYISARWLFSGSLSINAQSTRQRSESVGMFFPLLVCAYFDAVLFLELYRSVFLFLGVILYAIFASFLLTDFRRSSGLPDAGAH